MENPIKMDDLGVPLFLETPILIDGLRFDWIIQGQKSQIWVWESFRGIFRSKWKKIDHIIDLRILQVGGGGFIFFSPLVEEIDPIWREKHFQMGGSTN